MPDVSPSSELLRSLARLVRGLSALFWGLPASLLVDVQTARADAFKSFGLLPPLVCTGWLIYGLWQMGAFQKQERVWRSALDRAQLFGLVNLGLSPFLYWFNKVPASTFFLTAVLLLAVSGLFFLSSVNLVLQRLGAMLPDEALRQEIKQFTALNLNLLFTSLMLGILYAVLSQIPEAKLPPSLIRLTIIFERTGLYSLVPLLLLPLAMTMALLWKTKEVILDGVFDAKS